MVETESYKRSEISRFQLLKWKIEDLAGLKIHHFIAMLSNDEEVKELYREMEEALLEEGDQPKAVEKGKEIRIKLEQNTIKRMQNI